MINEIICKLRSGEVVRWVKGVNSYVFEATLADVAAGQHSGAVWIKLISRA